MADAQLDDFLGVKPAPAWRRYVKWALVAIGVVLLALLLKSEHRRVHRAEDGDDRGDDSSVRPREDDYPQRV